MQIYVYLGSQINMVIPNDFLWINMTVNGVHVVTCFCQVCRQQKVDQLLGAGLTNLQLYKHCFAGVSTGRGRQVATTVQYNHA